ncbi:uncharacterized protein LOC119768716 [Culex quinquefasciatus]|uniref:uncharacterized protein LOC119768716 n=1 Tax=Culex quinquefasciatus TaxID=7176 RepID=UPI0018E2AC50|nr:uncharacterized protein LOC119768716 [Culex quinquefasciatus]
MVLVLLVLHPKSSSRAVADSSSQELLLLLPRRFRRRRAGIIGKLTRVLMTAEKCNPTRPMESTKIDWTTSGLVCVQRVGDGQADRDAFWKNAALVEKYRNMSRK